jgi:hypothetical protein
VLKASQWWWMTAGRHRKGRPLSAPSQKQGDDLSSVPSLAKVITVTLLVSVWIHSIMPVVFRGGLFIYCSVVINSGLIPSYPRSLLYPWTWIDVVFWWFKCIQLALSVIYLLYCRGSHQNRPVPVCSSYPAFTSSINQLVLKGWYQVFSVGRVECR